MYVGDGSSDIHVMLHVNRGEGFTRTEWLTIRESAAIGVIPFEAAAPA